METYVCPHCFGDEGLRRRIEEIRSQYPNERCTFHPRYKGIPISAVAEIIDPVIRNNYAIGEYNRYNDEQEGESLEFVVEELTSADPYEVVEELSKQIIEDEPYDYDDMDGQFYASDQNYVNMEQNDNHHSTLWSNFHSSVVHSQRFFNNNAKELIEEIFDGIESQLDNNGLSPVYTISPGDSTAKFYRARIAMDFQQAQLFSKDPRKELLPPPERLRRPGRMNPAGIATFYGSLNFATCVAELRPFVGSIVVGAQFQLVRPIRVLDTTRFKAPIKRMSHFAKDALKLSQQWQFMQQFRNMISRPVSPSDEYLDYIPTQAVAEYLIHHHKIKNTTDQIPIEGIIFDSAQHLGGVNVALLGDAAEVEPEQPTRSDEAASIFGRFLPGPMATFWDGDRLYKPALSIVSKSVTSVIVRGAEYKFDERYFSTSNIDENDQDDF